MTDFDAEARRLIECDYCHGEGGEVTGAGQQTDISVCGVCSGFGFRRINTQDLARALEAAYRAGFDDANKLQPMTQDELDEATRTATEQFGWGNRACPPNQHGVYVKFRDRKMLCKFCNQEVKR